ncbi:hypothetical protein FACS18949_18440 [Clostridia bacterium]|nr:hypothetical protein FACS18949_18440 [Clostridia bacterium]
MTKYELLTVMLAVQTVLDDDDAVKARDKAKSLVDRVVEQITADDKKSKRQKDK